MKNVVFWDVALCRYFVNRRFGGTDHIHLQDIRNPRAMNQREQVAVYSYLRIATSQKTAFFIVIAVKTSNLTRIVFFAKYNYSYTD
jgi:hypothetical protein